MDSIELVDNLLAPRTLRLGRRRQVGRLALYPVFHVGAGGEYLGFTEAHRRRLVDVTEVGVNGQVPQLLLQNRAPLPVLVVEGEVLLGLKQTRVLNASVLAPARSRLKIPVSCVEMGRWQRVSAAALGADDFALSPKVRHAKTQSVHRSLRLGGAYASNQSEVWDRVGAQLRAHSVDAPMSSYADITQSKRYSVDALLARTRPRPGQSGVLAAIDGALCFDLFDRPETLAGCWRELVGSYLADSLVAPGQTAATSVAAIRTWLARIAASEGSLHPGVGLGETVVLASAGAIATALVYDGVVVHLAAFSEARKPRP